MATEAQDHPNRLNAPKIELCSTLSELALSAACPEPCRMGRSVEGPALRSRVLSQPSTSVEKPLQISSFYAKQTQSCPP